MTKMVYRMVWDICNGEMDLISPANFVKASLMVLAKKVMQMVHITVGNFEETCETG